MTRSICWLVGPLVSLSVGNAKCFFVLLHHFMSFKVIFESFEVTLSHSKSVQVSLSHFISFLWRNDGKRLHKDFPQFNEVWEENRKGKTREAFGLGTFTFKRLPTFEFESSANADEDDVQVEEDEVDEDDEDDEDDCQLQWDYESDESL